MVKKNRREFLADASKMAIAAGLGCYGLQSCDNGEKPSSADTTLTLDITAAPNDALQQTGGAVYVVNPNDADRPIIVVRVSETQVNAFSSRCTHAGCKVNLPSGGRAVCPCHNAVFDTAGNRLSGPANGSLTSYEAALNGNIVTIRA